MKIYFSILIFFLLSLSVYADSNVIPYKIELNESFLIGNDSIEIVIHNGKFLKKLKLIKNKGLIIKMNHFIPCFSGRYLSELEKLNEIREWNGITINFYYPVQQRMISVKSPSIKFSKLEKDSTYRIEFDQSEISELDRVNFQNMYINFVKIESQIKSKGFKNIAKHPYYSRQLKYNYLNRMDFTNYTVIEIENVFKMDVNDNETTEVDLYLDGSSRGLIYIRTKNGYIKSVE